MASPNGPNHIAESIDMLCDQVVTFALRQIDGKEIRRPRGARRN